MKRLTKSQYELVAEGLRVLPMIIRPEVVDHFIDLFTPTDSQFDKKKFLELCGIED